MISYEVEFPTQKSFSLKINGYSSVEGLDCKTIEAIGGDVKVRIENQTLVTVPYHEDISSDFTLAGYKERARANAVNVVAKLTNAAQMQTAIEVTKGDGATAVRLGKI
ncbi:hypothetical protein G3F67_004334 [Salmonella enterica subsp. enterica]|nr:hypothetical protein [Salmonella enterica subsp. enterica]EHD6704639.1 hypothetical protein [Salmonella enterica]EEG6117350.1 hypothetical protein [Salmonella enterica subsp. enterica]EEI4346195.1 hypothetical protein [Salmonella enterica subsp. enterica]EJB2157014.1 hypothetical protein [Salmonella enterica]